VKLVGFAWSGPVLRAVLSVRGTTVVAAAGESADGYLLLSVDQDSGVRLRAPSGEELRLTPAR
jgi:hypothetical protein